MRQLIQAQEDFWKKKLAKEEQLKVTRTAGKKSGNSDGKNIDRPKKQIVPENNVPDQSDSSSDATDVNIRLKRKSQEAIDAATAITRGGIPPIVGDNDFLREQAKKKKLLDEMRNRQRQQLDRLNSPLPSPTKKRRSYTCA